MVYIYDLEVFPNFFLAGFLPKNGDSPIFFELSMWRNDARKFDVFLRQSGLKLVGFNNLNYDYPIIHYLLNSQVLVSIDDADFLTQFIFKRSDDLIGRDFTSIPYWEEKIPQLDIYRVHHLDNKAKSASLKDIEFNIRHENVEDLIIPPHTYLMKDQDEQLREDVIKYNLNDLVATKKFYINSKKEILLRKNLSKKYHLKLINANDAKMGGEIFAAKLAPALGIPIRELKQRRTERPMVLLNECVFPYVNFKTSKLQGLLEEAKKIIIHEGETKGVWKQKLGFKGVNYTFGLGGIHGCIDSGFYQEGNGKVIVTSDVISYYPRLSMVNRFHPKHLSSIFCDVYEDIFGERQSYPKGTPENYGLKIALNGVFGKSNDKYSFFKDLKYMLTTTVNGQMLLMMLVERVSHLGQILMANTDGIEILIPTENVEEYYTICKKWEKFTRLELEHGQYKSMIIRDVNNYRAIFYNDDDADEDKEYEKGVFEINKMIHKDHSQMIVPKALKAYYQYGTSISEFIRNHDDIFDFYMRLKIKSNFSAEIRYVVGSNINTIQLSKTTRFYASTTGGYIFRVNSKNNSTAIKKNQKCTIANKHQEELTISDYNINYLYYERECYKIINAVDKGQTFHSIKF